MNSPQLEILISEDAIGARVEELALQISADYAHADEIVLVGVLRGAFVFLADLARRIVVPRRVDFIALSSYGASTESAGDVHLLMDVAADLAGRHVLLVEDIVDAGYTLDFALAHLAGCKPASLKSCVLIRKPKREQVSVKIDYLGFEVPDVWVVGYGLDYTGQYRALPYVAVLRDGTQPGGASQRVPDAEERPAGRG